MMSQGQPGQTAREALDLDTLTASALLHLHTGDQETYAWTKEELEAAMAATALSQVSGRPTDPQE